MKFFIAVFTSTGIAIASTNSLLESIRGSYNIQEWNGSPTTAKVEFKSSADSIGYELSEPLSARSRMTPLAQTSITRTNTGVRQKYEGPDGKTEIEYSFDENIFQMITSHCRPNFPCESDFFIPRWSENFGSEIDFKNFSKQIEGTYDISYVNEESFKKTGDVSNDTDESMFTFPYCPPGETVCLPGNYFFPYATTRAFKREISKSHVIVTLELSGKRFQWDDKAGTIIFRNFQAKLPKDKIVLLEHAITKKF